MTKRYDYMKNKSHYSIAESHKICTSFKEAVIEGLKVLAEKNDFNLYQKDINLSGDTQCNNYKIIVKFVPDNTLIIKQTKLGALNKNGVEMVELGFEWPQASPKTKKLIQSVKEKYYLQTRLFFEILPSVFNQLLNFEKQTYFSKRIYGALFSILKIYDLEFLRLNDKVTKLKKSKAKIIQNQYQKWLTMNNTIHNAEIFKDQYGLSNIIDGLMKDIQGTVNFIDHLVINNSNHQYSVTCSQQLELTINMLNSDLFAFSTLKKLSGESVNKMNSWDSLIINSLNMLITIDPLINNSLINLFIQDPEKGKKIIDLLQVFGEKQIRKVNYQEDYPLYDTMLKGYYLNDGTNTISD